MRSVSAGLFVSLLAACSEMPEPEPESSLAIAAHKELDAETHVEPAPSGAEPSLPTPRWPPASPPEPAGGDHVYSKVRFLWVHPEPRAESAWIGYLSLGERVRVRGGVAAEAEAQPGSGGGCTRWYAIEPRGYVCTGQDATLDPADPDVVELKKGVARHEPWPYEYGESIGTTVYVNVPPRRRQFFREDAFEQHMADVARAREAGGDEAIAAFNPLLVGVDLRPTGNPPPPFLLHLGPRSMPRSSAGKYGFPEVIRGSTLAYTYSFDADDRSWVMTWDRGIVPKDRVKVYPRSSFEGVPLGDAVKLPIAFFRADTDKLRLVGDGGVEPVGATFAKYAWTTLTGGEAERDGVRYLETTEPGVYVAAGAVSAPRLRDDLPERVAGEGEHRTWVDISITEGWLVAYEGRRPVYATMISPGRGGLPQTGTPLLETASTPVGDFAITGKFHTATMTSNASEKVIHAEVPYTQNFSGPYALHAAYWHDDWGVGKSGGCVNLSPRDAERLFAWTHPRLPRGWHGMRGVKSDADHYAEATVVSLHR